MIKGDKTIQMSLEERKAYMKKNLHLLRTADYARIELGIEGRFRNLQIWIGNEKCMADGGGKKMIYMRIDCANQYSVPLSEKTVMRLDKPSDAMKKLIKFGFTSDIEGLDEILEITKDMPIRPCISW